MKLDRLVLRKSMEYATKDRQYLSEVITLEIDGEAAQQIFSVTIVLHGEGLHCVVNHHSKQGLVYQRECTYATLTGPYSPKSDIGTLSPELIYLTQLYLSQGWLVAEKMVQYRFPTQEAPRLNHEVITMQKLPSVAEDANRLDCAEPRYLLLDCLRERSFDYDLRRNRYTKTENIYIDPVEPNKPRYLLCANYAYHEDMLNNAAGLAVLRRVLCLNRSDFRAELNRFVPLALEFVLLDGASGSEGADQYLRNLREEERKKILGVINLELRGQGDLLLASPPQSRGNGKLFVSLYYAAKQNKVYIRKDVSSPMAPIFERESIPLITITSQAPSQIGNAASMDAVPIYSSTELDLQRAVDFLRDLLHILAFVQGDEILEVPELSYVQNLRKVDLIKLSNKNH